MATDNSERYALLARLADEFAQRYRRGERPALQSYIDRYPDLADDIRELFPAMAEIEQVKEEHRPAAPETTSPPAHALALEQLGDYRILREIGRGGMGVVYEAEQISLGRHVAVKVLPAQALLDPRQRGRFEREARAAAKLHHTNIVPVYGVGESTGVHYYVMQFIHGLGLDDVLTELRRLRQPPRRVHNPDTPSSAPAKTRDLSAAAMAQALLSGQFSAVDNSTRDPGGVVAGEAGPSAPCAEKAENVPASPNSAAVHLLGSSESSSLSESGRAYWQSVARLGVQVADALAYAAGQGILHRDIKPSNLLLDTQGTVWVTDFGLAKADTDTDNLTRTGDVIGTLRYIAPERFAGKGDIRADLYSLGLTLYELLTLRPGFDEMDRNRLVKQVMHDEPPRPRKISRAVPRDLETIVLKAMARDPSHRYQTPTELAADLERFLQDRPIRARRVSEAEKLWRWARRNPALASLAVALLVSLLVGLAGVTWKWREADKQREEVVQANNKLQRQTTELLLDRGLAQATQGDIGQGMQWLVESLRAAPEQAADLRRLVRLNLAAWAAQVHVLRRTFHASAQVAATAFSPDGKRLLTGTRQGSNLLPSDLQLWDVASGQPVGAPIPHPQGLTTAAFSPSGQLVVTACFDNVVRLWETATGRLVRTLQGQPELISTVAFSPDGQRLLTGGEDRTVRMWSVATGEECGPRLVHSREVLLVAVRPDGQQIVTASGHWSWKGGEIQLWDTATGKPVGAPLLVEDYPRYLTFSPDGKRILLATPTAVRVADGTSGQWIGSPLFPREPTSRAALSPDGQIIVTASVGGIARLWDLTTRKILGAPLLYAGEILSVAFSPDGRSIVIGANDGSAYLWEIAEAGTRFTRNASQEQLGSELENRLLKNKAHRSPFQLSLATTLSSDRRRVLTGYANGIACVRDVATGSPVGTPVRHRGEWQAGAYHTGEILAAALSPDGQRILTGGRDYSARLWDLATGRQLGPALLQENWIRVVAFRPDGQVVLTGGYDGTARLWQAATGKPLGKPLEHGDIVWCAAFSPDGKTVVTGTTTDWSSQARVRLWEVATGKLLWESAPLTNWIEIVAFGPDGKAIVIGSRDHTARLLDAATGQFLGPPMTHRFMVGTAAISPNGRLLLTGSGDFTARLWDTATCQPVGPPLKHQAAVHAVAFSPDGQMVLTASNDRTARLWDVATGKPIGPPLSHRLSLVAAAFRLDGRTFVTVTADGEPHVWPVPEPMGQDVETLALQVQVLTGLELEGAETIKLTAATWEERQRRLGRADLALTTSAEVWHEAQERDAEQIRARFAAQWHLDHLLALRPDDWLLYARRAHLHRLAGDLAQAEADDAQAWKYGSRAARRNWYRQCAVACELAEEWPTARWYLDRLLALEPEDWPGYVDRAAADAQLGQAKQREADLERAVALGADSDVLASWAEEQVSRGHWEKATQLYGQAVERGLARPESWQHSILVDLRVGEEASARKLWESMHARFPDDPPSWQAARAMSHAGVFGADVDPKGLVALAEFAVKQVRPDGRHLRHELLRTWGAALYRAGRTEEAVQRLQEGMALAKGQGVAQDWLFLALSYQRLGQDSQATEAREKARALPVSGDCWDKLEIELLDREIRKHENTKEGKHEKQKIR